MAGKYPNIDRDDTKSCPFCGSDNINNQETDDAGGCRVYQYYCVPCWGNVMWHYSPEDALRAWNARPLTEVKK